MRRPPLSVGPQAPSRDLEALFLAHLPAIERLIAWVCHRRCLGEEADDFSSWAKLKLIENDYRILRLFSGICSLEGYLITVLLNMARDYRVQLKGRWRPSAAAERLGERAVQLDTLLNRDGRSFDEAVRILQTQYRAEESATALATLAAQLPTRSGRFFEGDESLAAVAGTDSSEASLLESDRKAALAKTEGALRRALARLADEDRLLLKLHFQEGVTVTEIARSFGWERRPLYHRLDKMLAQLRRDLVAEGVQPEALFDALGWAGAELTVELGHIAAEQSAHTIGGRLGAVRGVEP